MKISFSWPPSGCKFHSVGPQLDANCILLAAMQYKIPSLHAASDQPNEIFSFPIYFYGFLCTCTSAAPQRPAHGTVSSQVATHLRTDRVCRVLGRSWIRTQDYWFAVRCATIEPPLLHQATSPPSLSHLSSITSHLSSIHEICILLEASRMQILQK
jgi:hypothetical protein